MTDHEMTPDELANREKNRLQEARPEPPLPDAPEHQPLRDVDPGDEDGLPDGPAQFRVPS